MSASKKDKKLEKDLSKNLLRMHRHPLYFLGEYMKNNDNYNKEILKEALLTSITPFIFTLLLSIWSFLSDNKSIKENALWFGICSIFVIFVDVFFLYSAIKILKDKNEKLLLSIFTLIIAIISLILAIICLIHYIWRVNL